MRINGKAMRTIRPAADGRSVEIIDQTKLPHELRIASLRGLNDAAVAIKTMQVRGAPLIGVTAAYGLALALLDDASDQALRHAAAHLIKQRPTAVNLRWAIEEVTRVLQPLPVEQRTNAAWEHAARMADDDVEVCQSIGAHGVPLLAEIAKRKPPGTPVNVLTHCNAGWLACVDWGTATSPIYQAHDAEIPVHVWVDETRPRNQGAALTAYELGSHGVPHTIIADNAGGHLMQRGQVDIVIVGTDRVAHNGDVANKIGTYLKALAAHDTGVPFYVALPGSTIDWRCDDGASIEIEERSADEVLKMVGRDENGAVVTVEIAAPGSPAANPAFDVTPARLVTGLITERGVTDASRAGLDRLYPEHGAQS
ncbi:MAG: S-methyl-5-thioribose-1-phosphate isomerase [Hyphomicrobiaceae bacterium]|nr:S-methyl-5-thioribose-1-phosphate isomerase [Hyphomicrobiaceae bacterium]